MAKNLVDQPTAAPTAKLYAVGSTGVATALAVGVARHFGLDMPTEVAEALVLLGGWLGGYVKRDRHVAAWVAQAGQVVGEAVQVVQAGRHEAPEPTPRPTPPAAG